MLVFSSHYTQFAGNQECLVNVKYSTASDIVILGICFLSGNTEEGFRGLGFRGLGVEECFLFVAHKLRRMRIPEKFPILITWKYWVKDNKNYKAYIDDFRRKERNIEVPETKNELKACLGMS